jgi:hypothetical protein
MTIIQTPRSACQVTAALALSCAMLATLVACRAAESGSGARTFATPQAAVLELAKAVKDGNIPEVMQIFGPDAKVLVDTADPVAARRNQQVFTAAVAEHWRLENSGADRATLVIGFEEWPFPIPIMKDGRTWRFDSAAGEEEILARRIGRNELAVITICRAYVAAQQRYAKYGHDGKPAGLYAAAFRSEPDRQNGLYWQARRGQRRSPLGDLFAAATVDAGALRAPAAEPQPFHGYYFRILTAQGDAAPGGARDYVTNGELTGGFALVAWPAQYDVTGIMTFVINQDRVVWERDLGPDTAATVRAVSTYNPDAAWAAIQ